MTSYIALLRKQPRSDYGVDFPDFPGCITAGRSLEEARRMAAEALAFHVDGMREDAQPVPPPSSMDTIMASDTIATRSPFWSICRRNRSGRSASTSACRKISYDRSTRLRQIARASLRMRRASGSGVGASRRDLARLAPAWQ